MRAPTLVHLDAEGEARAVEALATLLRPLLAGGASPLKDTVKATCDGADAPDGAVPPSTGEEAE